MAKSTKKKDVTAQDASAAAAIKRKRVSAKSVDAATASATASAATALARAQVARQTRVAQAFSQIVAVLMRDPAHRSLTLADLEWLVLPPLMAGQFRLAHATTLKGPEQSPTSGIMVPVALALWALVSPAIDKVLSNNLDRPVRLRATDWVSGDIPWLITVAGHGRAIPEFLRDLAVREFKGRPAKMRLRGADGTVTIKALASA